MWNTEYGLVVFMFCLMKYYHERKKERKAAQTEVTDMNGACFCVWAADRVIVVPKQDRGQEVRGELWCICIH